MKWKVTRIWYVDAERGVEALTKSKNWKNEICRVERLTDLEFMEEQSDLLGKS